MLNSIANKLLPLHLEQRQQIVELPSESDVLNDTDALQWQNKFKQCSEKLGQIQNECANHATYWSAFFENQLIVTRTYKASPENHVQDPDSPTKGTPTTFVIDYEDTVIKIKSETEKKLNEFERKIATKLKDIQVYIGSMDKLFKKRKGKKAEIGKNQYYFCLYDSRDNAFSKDENALKLTAKKAREYDHLKSQLQKAKKELAAIEKQMQETFPQAIIMYTEFVNNINDIIFYDQQEIYDSVIASMTEFCNKHESELLQHHQLINNWRSDIVFIKKQLGNADTVSNNNQTESNRHSHHRRESTLTGIPAKSELPQNDKKPKETPKVNSAGMRSLNLDPKKSNLKKSKTISHRRSASKTFDLKAVVTGASSKDQSGLGIQISDYKGQRQSVRSFSSLSLELNDSQLSHISNLNKSLNNNTSTHNGALSANTSLAKDDDSFSFTSSVSSLNGEDAFTNLVGNSSNSPMLSPAMSPNRLKRSSVLSADSLTHSGNLNNGSNNNRISMLSTTSSTDYNRYSTFSGGSMANSNRGSSIYAGTKRPQLLQDSSNTPTLVRNPNQSPYDLIVDCPVTTDFKTVNEGLKRLAVQRMSISAQIYLKYNQYYKEETANKWDYRELAKRQKNKIFNKEQDESDGLEPVKTARKVKAKNAFDGTGVGGLSFEKDETLTVLSEKASRDNWWIGRSADGRIGEFPVDAVATV